MNEPLASGIARRLTAEIATSALPDAPVRVEPTSSRPRAAAAVSRLRRRMAYLLAGLADRLDPGVQLSSGRP